MIKTNQTIKLELLTGIKQIWATTILMLLSFLFLSEVNADEIGPSTCGNPIIVQGDIHHYLVQNGGNVSNATDPDMYKEEIYGKNLTAIVENLPEGSYTVEIYMAEQYHKSSGARLFNIYYGRTLIKERLDIYSEVGANSEYKFSYPITYSPDEENNVLSIRFQTLKDNGKFNTIRILNDNQELVACVMASELIKYFPSDTGNPFVRHIFTADPSAHEFEGKMYVYPSHDKNNANWYNMRDYHVFSSSDLSTWEDHGIALDIDSVPWASEYMWAPDCAYKDGWYYFYFPARDIDGEFRIGVATSQSPSGPFIPEAEPITGSFSVDPAVFIDDDGQAYMYFGGDGHGGQTTPWVAKLDDNMKEFSEAPKRLNGINYWFEACWMNKIEDTYYLSYSTGTYHPSYPSSSAIAYATSSDPMGPFTYKGVVNGYVSGWTNHHSIVEYKGQSYFFYHNAELSGGVNEKRSIAADYLHFKNDGSIQKVVQTDRGIGSYDGLARIEAENYGETGGVLKEECSEGGYQVSFDSGDSIVFNNVDFEEEKINTISLRVASVSDEGTIEVRSKSGELLGTVQISNTGGSENWQIFSGQIEPLKGKKNILLKYVGTESNPIHLNWIDFTDTAVSVLDLKNNGNKLNIYPNPADDFVYLNLPNQIHEVFVRIYDNTGKLVQMDNVADKRLDIEHLNTGIYYLLIYDKGNEIKYHEKLVVK